MSSLLFSTNRLARCIWAPTHFARYQSDVATATHDTCMQRLHGNELHVSLLSQLSCDRQHVKPQFSRLRATLSSDVVTIDSLRMHTLLRELDGQGRAGCRLLLGESTAGGTAPRSTAAAQPHVAGPGGARGGIAARGRIGAGAASTAVWVERIYVVGAAIEVKGRHQIWH